MKFAVFVPQFGDLADPRLLAELATEADEAGWDGFFLWDHVNYHEPATHVLDPWISLAAVACATTRLRLGALVTPLARRRPWIVARQLAALDLLSAGRVVFGVGLGMDDAGRELSAFGEELDARRRAQMLDEGLDLVHDLLAGREVDHDGPNYKAKDVRFLPTPLQDPVPTWVAMRWPHRAPLRRATRYDGVHVIRTGSPDDIVTVRSLARSMRPEQQPFDVIVDQLAGADPAPWAAAGVSWFLTRFSQYDARVPEVRAVIADGPAR